MSKRTAKQGSFKHGRVTRMLFVSKECRVLIDANGRPSYFIPRHTGTTYSVAKFGALS